MYRTTDEYISCIITLRRFRRNSEGNKMLVVRSFVRPFVRPSVPLLKRVNISDPIVQIYFIFGPNTALHRAINILIKNFQNIQNGHHAGIFTPSAL